MFTVGIIRAPPPPSLRNEVRKITMEFFSRGFWTRPLADAWRHSWFTPQWIFIWFCIQESFIAATWSSAESISTQKSFSRRNLCSRQLHRYGCTVSSRALCKHTNSFLNSNGASKVSKHYYSAHLHTTGQTFYSTSSQIIHKRRAGVTSSMSLCIRQEPRKETWTWRPSCFLMKDLRSVLPVWLQWEATNDCLHYQLTCRFI